jgi:hypothetical protein
MAIILGYRYPCSACGTVLADTSLRPDGNLRGEGNTGSFRAGRQLTPAEVQSLRDEHAHFGAGEAQFTMFEVREEAVSESAAPGSADRFFDWLDGQEAKAAEVGDKLKPLGFGYSHTGGGCTAWKMVGGDGSIVCVTDGNSSAPASLDEPCMVGWSASEDDFYSGENTEIREYPTVQDFLAAVTRGEVKLPAPKKKES